MIEGRGFERAGKVFSASVEAAHLTRKVNVAYVLAIKELSLDLHHSEVLQAFLDCFVLAKRPEVGVGNVVLKYGIVRSAASLPLVGRPIRHIKRFIDINTEYSQLLAEVAGNKAVAYGFSAAETDTLRYLADEVTTIHFRTDIGNREKYELVKKLIHRHNVP